MMIVDDEEENKVQRQDKWAGVSHIRCKVRRNKVNAPSGKIWRGGVNRRGSLFEFNVRSAPQHRCQFLVFVLPCVIFIDSHLSFAVLRWPVCARGLTRLGIDGSTRTRIVLRAVVALTTWPRPRPKLSHNLSSSHRTARAGCDIRVRLPVSNLH